MPDLLTHVLLVYALGTAVTWVRSEIDPRYVAVGMVGAVIPDLAKIELVVSARTVEALVGIPFAWQPIHRLGGVAILVGMGTLLFAPAHRRGAATSAFLGALTQFPLDSLIRRANDLSPPYLYPLTWWRPPAGNLYLSSDLWPLLPAALLAAVVWYHDRRRSVHSG